MQNNKELVDNFMRRLHKKIKTLSKKELFKAPLIYFAKQIIPLIPLEDLGYSRGVYVGVLKNLGVKIESDVIRNKTKVKGVFDEKTFSEGLKKGMRLSVKITDLSIPLHFGNADLNNVKKVFMENKKVITGVSQELKKELKNRV